MKRSFEQDGFQCKESHWEKALGEAFEWAVNLRREFHRQPELGLREYETKKRIETALKECGLESHTLWETGLISTLQCAEGGPHIVLRADMDALPMQENGDLVFRSIHDGVMHSCGHDIHMAALLGAAKLLCVYQEELKGSIRFLFQPAEETCGGAEKMMKHGALNFHEGLKVKKADYVFGMHVKPELLAGSIGLKSGAVHAASDLFHIEISGSSCHGAYPHEGVDAICCGAQIVGAAQSIVSRNVNPVDSAVITFGEFHGGAAKNILADRVIIEGTIRSLKKETQRNLRQRLREMVEHICAAYQATGNVMFEEGYPALFHTEDMMEKVKSYLRSAQIPIMDLEEPTMGVEDFSYFLKETAGAFLFLGSGFPGRKNAGLHSSEFLVNEECLKTAIQAYAAIVFSLSFTAFTKNTHTAITCPTHTGVIL